MTPALWRAYLRGYMTRMGRDSGSPIMPAETPAEDREATRAWLRGYRDANAALRGYRDANAALQRRKAGTAP